MAKESQRAALATWLYELDFNVSIEIADGHRTDCPAYCPPKGQREEAEALRSYQVFEAKVRHFAQLVQSDLPFLRDASMVMPVERQGGKWNGPLMLRVPKEGLKRFLKKLGPRWIGEPTVNGANELYRKCVDADASVLVVRIDNGLGKAKYVTNFTEQRWPPIVV